MPLIGKLRSFSSLDAEMLNGTVWMMLSYGIKLSLQLVSFIMLARVLGPESFGLYMAMLSFVVLLEPFFDLGAYHLVVDDITKKVKTSVAVGNSLVLSSLVLPLGLLILLAGYTVLFADASYLMLAEIGLSQFVGGRCLSLTLGVNIAHGTIRNNAILEILNGTVRFVVVMALFLVDGDLETWVHLQLTGNIVMAMLVFAWIHRRWGIGFSGFGDVIDRLRAGMHFAIGYAARNANTELDKIMIYKFSSVEGTGIYAAATRFAVMACVPVNALLATIHRYFFIEGGKSYLHARRYARKIIPATTVYGVFASIVLFAFADMIIMLLGEGFEVAAVALRYLALYPLIQSILLPYADALTGSNLQNVRSRGTLISMVANVGLNFALIPFYGWQGAIIATLASQTLLLLFVSVYARRYIDKDAPPA